MFRPMDEYGEPRSFLEIDEGVDAMKYLHNVPRADAAARVAEAFAVEPIAVVG